MVEFNLLEGIAAFFDLINTSFESREVVVKILIKCSRMLAIKNHEHLQSINSLILGLLILESSKPFEM